MYARAPRPPAPPILRAVDARTAEPVQAEDLAILALEGPTVAGHACKVVVLADGAPRVEAIREEVGRRLGVAPGLTRRLGEAGGAPAWVPDEGFDLDRHVVACPGPPLDEAGLRREVGRLFAERLDRSRPLWRMDVAPLADGGRAIIWRTHHALADGTAAMRYARAVLWDDVEPPARTPPGGRRAAAADDARRRGHLLAFARRELGEADEPSPFDGTIGTRREVAFATVPLAPLHDRARSACAATVNDAVLAVVAGGIRRWVEARHGRLGDVRLRVPVSLHHEGDDAANRDSFFTIAVPLDEGDPVARLAAVRAATSECKDQGDAERMDDLLRALGRASRGLRRLAERAEGGPRMFALAVSNVVGPRSPVAVLGAPVVRLDSIAEIGRRHALRVAVVSLAGALHLGFCADPEIVDDVQAMATGTEAEARALIGAA